MNDEIKEKIAFLNGLPKAELHVHLEGAIPLEISTADRRIGLELDDIVVLQSDMRLIFYYKSIYLFVIFYYLYTCLSSLLIFRKISETN